MKSKKIILLENILRIMARAVLAKYEPTIVGITGSVGKTSAKEAVYTVLAKKYDVRKNEKNYNNEIGIPLTILGVETGGNSLLKWVRIFLQWLKLLIFPLKYPQILILEMGVDRPGDMRYLTSFIKPFVGVITNISSSHIEFFGSIDEIAKEKGLLVDVLPQDGFAILNLDDERVAKMISRTKSNVLTFGCDLKATVSVSNVTYHYEHDMPDGISFKLNHLGKNIPIRLKRILARHQISAAISAVAAGIAFKINLVEIASALEQFNPPPGRLNLLKGMKGVYLIDDTYNASPTSTLAALEVLNELKAARKIAALGDMLELGDEEENGHFTVAAKIKEMGTDLFVVVGRRSKKAAQKIIAEGFPQEKVLFFNDAVQAGETLRKILQPNDLVLIKGSQGMRMEKVTEQLLENYLEDGKFLCRQSEDWKKIPFGNP